VIKQPLSSLSGAHSPTLKSPLHKYYNSPSFKSGKPGNCKEVISGECCDSNGALI